MKTGATNAVSVWLVRHTVSEMGGDLAGGALPGVGCRRVFLIQAIVEPDNAKFGTIPDEAKAAGLTGQSLPAVAQPCKAEPADCNYFARIDKGLLIAPQNGTAYPPEIEEVAALTGLASTLRGQIAWMNWTGGNDRFWDYAARSTAGAFDLLKTVSSYKGMAYGRYNRWSWLGLVNEPCFTEAQVPDNERFGLWLDRRDPACPPDRLADPVKYPGVPIGSRGKTVPVGSYYGEPSGVIGLRLFPNPDFDEKAKARWDPERFYNDPSYYNDRNLVRPGGHGRSEMLEIADKSVLIVLGKCSSKVLRSLTPTIVGST